MTRNSIQFQSGLWLPAFLEHNGTEALCRAPFLQHRWSKEYVCLDCGNTTGCQLARGV